MQQFVIVPVGASSKEESMKMGMEMNQQLMDPTNVADEGGSAPNIQENKEGLELLKIAKAKAKAGCTDQVDRKQTYNTGTGRMSGLTCIGQSSKFVEVDPFNSQVSKPQHYEEVSWKGVKRVVESFTQFFDEASFPKTARFEAMQELTRIAYEHDDDTIVKRSSVTFTDKDMVVTGKHNQSLCVATKINGFDFHLAMMDNGSFVNLMPLSTFKAARIPAKSLVPETLSISGVTSLGNTLGHVTVDLQVGPIRSKTRFYVMDTKLSLHVLLGRPWIHKFEGVASTYHQCFKGKYQGKEVVIKASQTPLESRVSCGDNSKEGATVGLQMKGE